MLLVVCMQMLFNALLRTGKCLRSDDLRGLGGLMHAAARREHPPLVTAGRNNATGPCSFLGHGSFYDFYDVQSRGLIGTRLCLQEGSGSGGGMQRAHNLFIALANASARLPHSHPLLAREKTSWLLIGDSTENRVVSNWCDRMKQAVANATRRQDRCSKWFKLTCYPACSVEFEGANGKRHILALSFLMNFGMDASTYASSVARYKETKKDSVDAATRIRQLARTIVTTPPMALAANEEPTFVTIHSCLWDMQQTALMTDALYKPAAIRRYGTSLAAQIAAARETFPAAATFVSTCKPLPGIIPPPPSEYAPPWDGEVLNGTRSRATQAALDAMAQHVVSQSPQVGLLYASAALQGFEHYATDGRHYEGAGATTLANVFSASS